MIADHNFNPWKVKADTFRVVASESMWKEPLKWDRAAAKAGERRRVFCASLMDVFEDWQKPLLQSDGCTLWECDRCKVWIECAYESVQIFPPTCLKCNRSAPALTLYKVRRRLFALIDATPNLDWLLLTKRPENIARMMPAVGFHDAGVPGTLGHRIVLPNLWLGVSVENQDAADKRIPHLLSIPAAVRFLSCEPLIGPVDISEWMYTIRVEHNGDGDTQEVPCRPDIHWVICGGEGGPGAKPFNTAWARSLLDQCRAVGVPFFLKQVGSKPYEFAADGHAVRSWGDAKIQPNGNYVQIHLRDPKGGDPSEWPEDLRAREWPKVKA